LAREAQTARPASIPCAGAHLTRKTPGSYRLTPQIETAYAGGPVVCLAIQARGRAYTLHAERPRFVAARDRVLAPRADAIGPDGTPIDVDPAGSPILSRVTISGGLETAAGYHDECGGWSDGYDAIAERMCAALVEGDVLLTIDSPGGAVIGLPECVDAILAAKAMYGRRITVIIGAGMAASAGYWLAATLADPGELYITRSSMAGSIGARSAHCNEEGALAIAGMAITDFAYPAGKIAMSPNRAPTATGVARGERDVMAAFEAFAGAVSAARPMLTRKAIVRLDADMLTGSAAVAAGLADAVAPVEDVERWALYRAASSGDQAMSETKTAGETPPEKPGESPADASGCKRCGEMPGEDARYCAKCGEKVGAEMPDEDPEDDDAPESSKPGARLAPAGASVATMIGLHADASEPAVKTALAALLSERDHVRKVLGASDIHSVKGKLRAMSEDVAMGIKAAAALKTERKANEARERMDHLLALAAADLPGLTRGELIEDVIGANAAGEPIVTGIRPKAGNPIANAPIADLRAYAAGKLANVAPRERSPYQPDEEAAKKPAAELSTKALENDPAVKQAVAAGVPLADAIAAHARNFPATTPTMGAPR